VDHYAGICLHVNRQAIACLKNGAVCAAVFAWRDRAALASRGICTPGLTTAGLAKYGQALQNSISHGTLILDLRN
jgi:hypothetical protein